MSVILWCQWSAWGRLPSVDAGILQVLAGQFYHGVADVDLAGDDVGNEAGTVLVREVDLAVGVLVRLLTSALEALAWLICWTNLFLLMYGGGTTTGKRWSIRESDASPPLI